MLHLNSGKSFEYSRINADYRLEGIRDYETADRGARSTIECNRNATEDYLDLASVKEELVQVAGWLVEVRRARARSHDREHWARFCDLA